MNALLFLLLIQHRLSWTLDTYFHRPQSLVDPPVSSHHIVHFRNGISTVGCSYKYNENHYFHIINAHSMKTWISVFVWWRIQNWTEFFVVSVVLGSRKQEHKNTVCQFHFPLKLNNCLNSISKKQWIGNLKLGK